MSYMNRFLFLLCIFSVCSLYTVGQYDPSKVRKKAAQLYEEALAVAGDGKFNEGITILQQAIRIDNRFADAFLSIAGMFGELKNYDSSIRYYRLARDIDSVYFKDYNLPYSINLSGKGDFVAALAAVNEFLTIPNLRPSSIKAAEYRRDCYEFAIEYQKLKPLSDYRFQPINMGDSVNSRFSEYFPTITIEGNQLVFTRRVNNANEDFYTTQKTRGNWSVSRGLLGAINTNQNEGAQNISQDGEWLIFTGCNFPDGEGSCDLYISYLTSDGWSSPENLGPRINTAAWESAPSLSPDKRELYFASNREGGYGASDIYISRRLPNGLWSQPENAGPSINTAGNESCPFIHADNLTLYFTSDGHRGYGGDDLFVVRKLPANNWSKVENLGFPINTIENEGSLVVAADGKTAFYASDRSDSKGGLDLYTFELRSDIRPARTLWVTGRVFDIETKKGLPSAIELTELSSAQTISKLQTDETGNFLVTLPVGKDYAFNVNRKGYLFFSENFPLSQKPPDSTYRVDIPLQPLEANATVVLKNIFFDVNKYELKEESTSELDKVVLLLKENPNLTIQINGHTDNVGNPADNLKLSNDRARAVVNYLRLKGIETGRLKAKGFGATKPVASNESEQGRSMNRRTELTVVSK
jgi:outer membrane protein OmpA-like peptidoglycan-associated protein